MKCIKKIGFIILAFLFVFAASDNKKENQSAGKKPVAQFGNEAQVLEQVKHLKNENKIEEALEVLNHGLKQYPLSNEMNAQKYWLLRGQKRYEVCLLWLRNFISKLPAEAKKDWIGGKIDLLLPLIQSELKKGDTDKAFEYFNELADSGYRGFHQLRRNQKYESLRNLSGFKEVMKKIAKNTGIGQPANDFSTTLTNGETFTLSEQKGKVILVDFWSTSCGPCVRELPNLRKIYRSNKDKSFDIISISLDNNKEKLTKFLAQNPMPWRTVYSGKGWKDDIAQLYRVSWIPSLWLVDKKGILRYFDYRGEDLKTVIEEMLEE